MDQRLPALLQAVTKSTITDDLTLVTSTLSNDSSWLINKLIAGTLQDEEHKSCKVVLVSWLRGWDSWRMECKRTVGLDLNLLNRQGRFVIIDGLAAAVNGSPDTARGPPLSGEKSPQQSLRDGYSSTPIREDMTSRVLPNRTVPTGRVSVPVTAEPISNTQHPATFPGFDITKIRDKITATLDTVASSEADNSSVRLIIDSIDMLPGLSPNADAASILAMLASLRRHRAVHSTITTLSSSLAYPFAAIKQSSGSEQRPLPTSSLDLDQQALLVDLAHSSDRILSLRPLDTGAAEDVSGVLRITKGGAGAEVADERRQEAIEGEWLYLVKSDGKVKIWDRRGGVG